MIRHGMIVLLGMGLSGLPPARAQDAKDLKPGSKPIEVKLPAKKDAVSYANQIVEILEDKCTGCHGSALAENRLSLEGVPAMIKGGKRGTSLVPGKADQSLLFRMAAHRVEPVMPPKDKPGNASLTPDELGLLKVWIDSGARDDSGTGTDAPKPRQPKPVVLGELPPGVQPINAVDLTAGGSRVAIGRANVVQVYDIDSGLEIVTLGGHKDLIQSLRFSPDGRVLAAGSYQIVSLWNVPTGGPSKSLTGHSGAVLSLAARDEARVFSGGADKTIRCWNLADGKQEWSIALPSGVSALAIASEGKRLVAGTADGTVHLIDPDSHRDLSTLKGHTGAVEALAPLPSDGKSLRFASASADGTARIWAVALDGSPASKDNKEAPGETVPIVLRGHKGPVHAMAVLPGSGEIITGGEDAAIRLWNARDGGAKGVVNAGHKGPITALAVSTDGKLLASASADKTVRLTAPGKDSTPRVLDGFAGPVHGLSFSPKGDRLAAAGAEGGIKVWETTTGRGVIAFGHTPAKDGGGALPLVRSLAFTAEGKLVSASDEGTLRTWSFSGSWSERGVLGPHVDRVLALDFSPDGQTLAAGGGAPASSGELKIWDAAGGKLVRSLDSLHSDTIFALRFSPDGKRLASGAADKFVKVIQPADGKELRSFEGHTHHVMAVDWKSDGKQLISGGADKALKLWDFDSGEQVRTLQEAGKQITSGRWIAGKPEVVAASGDAQVRTWNADSGAVARGFGGPADYVYSVAASPDGTRIAAGGAESILFVWNGANGQILRKLGPVSPGR
ncbi:MAG: c-type cytochrome domain-containing protein [Isosphaeraceae bacterium]